jgi:type IX secretion system PorP/SprF family membrane protein
MKNFKLYHLLVFCLVAMTSQAQQIPMGSQYYANMFALNPAYSASGEGVQAFLTHRNQFNGVGGGPQTNFISVNGKVGEKFGLGLIAYSDVTDILSKTSVMLNYAYQLRLSTNQNLTFGLAAGVQNFRIAMDKAHSVDAGDPLLTNENQSRTGLGADFGLVYNLKQLEVSFGIPQLFTNNSAFATADQREVKYKNVSHLRSTAKYVFDINETRGLTLFPMVLVRTVKAAPSLLDLSLVLDSKKMGWLGLTYHNDYALAVSVGLRFKGFTFGYAHDFITGRLNNYVKNSSEFLLAYNFGKTNSSSNKNSISESRLKELEQENKRMKAEELKLKEELERAKKEDEAKPIIEEPKPAEKPAEVAPTKTEIEPEPETKPESKPEPEAEKWILRKGEMSDYATETTNKPKSGYYMVIGSFSSKANAEKFRKSATAKGLKGVQIVYNSSRSFYQVFGAYSENEEELRARIEEYKEDGMSAWILSL